ncbi:beta-1,3-glucanase family protein, partial [Saccharothrix coeruleofusca]
MSALVVGAAVAAGTLIIKPVLASGPDLLPLTVTNNSGRSEAVHLYVLGTDIRPGGKLGYVNQSGTFTAWSPGANPPVAAPDVSIAGPANGSSVTLKVPR